MHVGEASVLSWRKSTLALVLGVSMLAGAVPAAAAADPQPDLAARQSYWDVVQVVNRIRPSVAGIVVTLAPARPGGRPGRTAGTGLVYRADGYIVTNAHVVEDATQVMILLPGGQVVTADPAADVWADYVSDIAVIRIKRTGLTVPTLADSDQVQVGQLAVAVGNPLGFRLGNTVSVGVVSGIGRSLGTGYPFLQTDAAINPGNSGGPLLNARGQVLGLNSAKVSEEGIEGLAFAIPANVVKQMADTLIEHHKVTRPWLGFDLEESEAAAMGLPTDDGLTVTAIRDGGPSGRQVQKGDELMAVNGQAVHTLDGLAALLARYKPGQSVTLSLKRDGVRFEAQAVLGVQPNAAPGSAEAADVAAAPGIWRSLTGEQAGQAVAYARRNNGAGFDQFARGYVQPASSGTGTGFLQTEFMYLAYRYWVTARTGGELGEGLILESLGKMRGKLGLSAWVPMEPVAPGAIPALTEYTATLTQGARSVGGTRSYESLSGAPATMGFRPPVSTGGSWRLVHFQFPARDLNALAPITVTVKSEKGDSISFKFELKDLR